MYISAKVKKNEGYIDNIHFKSNGIIHWDPNNPESIFEDKNHLN